ncbi:MAG: 4-(cytidine 5'-diphospho)-2-C-methyl-D-erythritol kinase [Sulfurimicrobium sp.]|nr:4-(cytidine 5'-diphospho)-2-C-methyl-D-erythritol kinase [Sulfurimicrobium sp.]MDO9190176.1 4-(cytidine 5'-diphospho)-2-C-methyl-D-erythritol kinase [Sulfurimicrobium sp.]MDP1704237.1 4-(cytidine 5'-diphospho)-2-C-methyl-D-erythritol kinase [Sulfurimicrobium sp.]MDP2199783.1 4-(cytidine 5'-diphospho)-2-C-methyl-D-erythritol kinase [Sulfurimicrobium sp.]MDP3688254.1 4-(cytidine 5'-diphospho)-2-C-methyl-D-erythritol kinase [Sulfurimicrobium sp.]
MSDITYPAPAKLNLFLHIVGQRPDGYHLLQSVFRFIDYGDRLRFTVRDDGQVTRSTELPGVAPDQDLVVRAARLLQEHTGCGLGVEIAVEKCLPMGGGLGGGSSDAATTLLALNRLWQLNLPRVALQQLGLRLGADVPVFVFGESAFAEGIGERLQPIRLPSAWYVVLIPPVSVATAEIFAAPELTRNTTSIKIPLLLTAELRNDLQAVVCKRYPKVAEYLNWLGQRGRARMTGSGACVFAEFDSEDEASQVLAQKPAGWQGFVARGLDRHPLWDFAD